MQVHAVDLLYSTIWKTKEKREYLIHAVRTYGRWVRIYSVYKRIVYSIEDRPAKGLLLFGSHICVKIGKAMCLFARYLFWKR